ncbi:MAG: hypothetical protein ACPG32_15030 [Akkermansiaceae bacterium]
MFRSKLNWNSNDYGWVSDGLPEVNFRGVPVTIECHTRSIPSDEEVLAIDEREESLIDIICSNLSMLVEVAQREVTNYYAQHLEGEDLEAVLSRFVNPHFWIDRTTLDEEGEDQESLPWSFVVGFAGDEDHGTHVEFAGLTHVDTWGGG